ASYDRRAPDLILLDLNLPDGDGFEVVRHIRERSGTPIIVLSARGGERDKVNALDLGADDYITKPFGIDELLARVRVALRHLARLRRKIEDDPQEPRYLVTEPGVGYRFRSEEL